MLTNRGQGMKLTVLLIIKSLCFRNLVVFPDTLVNFFFLLMNYKNMEKTKFNITQRH
uniref:Uncharacterized protein n=1 Tax=Lepeophtheirus salmonis TaxID=72036 RepID=A0A0K2U0G7_LEPSM